MMIRFLLVLAVAASLLSSSCRTARKIQTAIARKDTIAVPPVTITDNPKADSIAFIKENYNRIISNRINFTTFSGKIDVDYTDADGKKYNVTAHVRMYN
jgi:hypothetical protein